MRKLILLSCALLALGAGLAGAAPASIPETGRLWGLFRQSFDIFTVLLVFGSVVSVAVIFSCLIDLRASRILPRQVTDRLLDLAASGRREDLRELANKDESFVPRVVSAALRQSSRGRDAMREAAELAAAEESARYFRRVELLNVIGNLGPLVGLAGTVWGMILAFTSLGETGGQAGPADLSLGISKALFHTLLGLCLAIPCLLAYGIYRAIVDRICTRGMIVAAEIVEKLPEGGGRGSD